MMSDNGYKIVLQARTGATRLPGKMTREFVEGQTILQVILQELLRAFAPDQIVVATSVHPADAAICEQASTIGVQSKRGSEQDVLRRFLAATHDTDHHIVRICADNPFLKAEFIHPLLDACSQAETDYASYQFPDGTLSILSHVGLFAEVVRRKTLVKINELVGDGRHREHLTSHILDFPNQYGRALLPVPDEIARLTFLRLTVDTASDFEVCRSLYDKLLNTHGPEFTMDQLLGVIRREPAIQEKMAANIAANVKR